MRACKTCAKPTERLTLGPGLLAHHQAGPSGDASSETGPADVFGELDDHWGLAFASLNLGGALLLHKPRPDRGSAPDPIRRHGLHSCR